MARQYVHRVWSCGQSWRHNKYIEAFTYLSTMIGGRSAIHIEDSVSSLSLQQALYYNTIYSGVYLVFSILHIIEKRQFVYFSVLHETLYPPMVALWALGELCRLYCGYKGNLSEKVPETSAFLLLTIFPQTPCLVYLTFFQEHIWPLDRLLGMGQMAFLFLELGIGFMAFRALIRRQTAQFYRLCQEDGWWKLRPYVILTAVFSTESGFIRHVDA